MRFLAPALLLLCLVPAWAGDERTGVECGLYAIVDLDDAGALAVYDGLRKGLELAQMPRVCREDLEPSAAVLATFLKGLPAAEARPVFAIGEQVSARLAEAETKHARVLALERYTIKGVPLRALPEAESACVVYADLPVRRVGTVVHSLSGMAKARVALAIDAEKSGTKADRALSAFLEAAALLRLAAQPETRGVAPPAAVLHLRFGVGEQRLSFAAALARARALKAPLISDDRARFGQGAVVTLVAHHDLVGRATAETALRLRKDPTTRLLPRAVPGMEVWVDLAAADAQGLKVPLPFIARADKLRRGASRAPVPKKGSPR